MKAALAAGMAEPRFAAFWASRAARRTGVRGPLWLGHVMPWLACFVLAAERRLEGNLAAAAPSGDHRPQLPSSRGAGEGAR